MVKFGFIRTPARKFFVLSPAFFRSLFPVIPSLLVIQTFFSSSLDSGGVPPVCHPSAGAVTTPSRDLATYETKKERFNLSSSKDITYK